jgi:peptidyl-prolyl cis-trans isomerase B (cyclophilin B)
VQTAWLDGKHTVFGRVLGDDDQAVVDAIQGGDTMTSVTIDGDWQTTLEAKADHVTRWNATLDDRFSHLKPVE